jgi:dimeric dUTPase (all-alpha-NTP-PPase superfamily)
MAHEPPMTDTDLLTWMGTDARRWASAYHEKFGGDEGTLISWFANAVEAGRNANTRLVWMGDQPLAVDATQDRLAVIMRLQREFQEVTLGHGPLIDLNPKARGDYFRTQAFSLMVELVEASNEIAWKPWATSEHFNTKPYSGEIIDALHFVINLALLADMSADELFEGYITKQRRNRERQQEGYDGVAGKCPGCRRSYDDAGVLCTPVHSHPEEGAGAAWCDVNRREL